MTKDTYRAALREARDSYARASSRLYEVDRETRRLKSEMALLRRTITALAAMCSEDPALDKLGITEAVSEAMEDTPFTVSTGGVIAILDSMGFELETQKNAAASVHAVLTRLAEKGKITKITDEKDNSVKWRGPNYDPDFVDVPF